MAEPNAGCAPLDSGDEARGVLASAVSEAAGRWPLLVGLLCLIVVGNGAAALFFRALDSLYLGTHATVSPLDLTAYDFALVASMPLLVAAFLVEARIVGWRRSSLHRLFAARSASCRTDLFYGVLYLSNLLSILGVFFSLGIGYYLSRQVRDHLGWQLLRDCHPAVTFAVLLIVIPLVYYWVHRLFHTRWLWEFHKVHHSAEEMTILTNFRTHPFVKGTREAVWTFFAAGLGASPPVILSYLFVQYVIVLYQHSSVDREVPLLERYLIIGATGHHVHHSSGAAEYRSNYGIVVFWDWLFGTYDSGRGKALVLGAEPGPYHNSGGSLWREMFGVFCLGMGELARQLKCDVGSVLKPIALIAPRGPLGALLGRAQDSSRPAAPIRNAARPTSMYLS